uniref:Uncharacterized protein n=1 Tax=Brassica campestris TaxID=3711 RepID=A0A3P6C8T6_BRACM|nr:unnamed protein product [Brassica rapa]
MRMLLGSTTTRFQSVLPTYGVLALLALDDLAYKKEKVKVYDCFQKESNSIDIPQVKKLAVLISNLLVESSGDEVDKVKMIPFEIEQAQRFTQDKTSFQLWDISCQDSGVPVIEDRRHDKD